MSEKEWAIQYTDEQYLTRKELAQAMHTSLVDGYWMDVRNYRGKNAVPFAHRTISNQRFWLCASVGVKAKISAFDEAVNHLLALVSKLDEPKLKDETERAFLLSCLTSYVRFMKIDVPTLSIKALLNGTYHEDNPAHAPIISYLRTLRLFLSKAPEKADADFLAEAYGSLLGQEELTKFYRTMDYDNSASRARYMTGGDYHYAPYEAIEPLMNEFFAFSLDEGISMSSRAIGALYFLDLVKPFWDNNRELACLLGKTVIAKATGNNAAFLLPLEAVFQPNSRYDSLYLETQHSGDLTYIITYAIDLLTPLIASLENSLKDIRLAAYRSEMRPLSPSEKTLVEAAPVEPTQMSLLDGEKKEEAAPAAEEPIPAAEEPTPVAVKSEEVLLKPVEMPHEERPQPKPVPKAAPKKAAVPAAQVLPASSGELAIAAPEAALSEKEIKEYVQYLLESNPSLNKNQATFLSNHCTMGHYYTIQQFKSSARCAYETARTSMDKLAEQGYYEKKALKNKYVYTPVKQGEKR